MRIYTLYKAFTATADAAVNIQIQFRGIIRQIAFVVSGKLDANGEAYIIECGLATTMQSRIHDSVGALAAVSATNVIANSESGIVDAQNIIFPCSQPVLAGDKVYLHGLLTGINDVKATCLVTVG